MNRIFQILFTICLLLTYTACTKDADVKLPTVESKLVISSFISPQDTMVKVQVTLSQPLYNNSNSGQYSAVIDATVQISDGNITQLLAYNSIENYYFADASLFPITSGITYLLTVSTPDGKNINASTTVPNLNSTLTYTSQAINIPNSANSYNIEASWNDTPGTENFYRLSYYSKYFYEGSSDTTYYSYYSGNFSDNGNDGKVFHENFEVYKDNSTSGVNDGEIYLVHASKEYYLFHNKLNDAAFSDGPFSEPSPMYSNINGGFGVFAGYNQYKVLVFLQ